MCDVSHFLYFSACCISRLTCTFGAVFIPRLQSMVSLSLITRKPWTRQRTVAMSVWTGPVRHQLHRFRRVLKLVNVKCIILAWRNAIGQIAPGRVLDALRERFLQRGAEACALLTMRIQRSAMKGAITDDLHAWLGKLACEANEAAAKGDMGRVFAIAKKMKSEHDRPHRVIRDEDGVLLVDEDQVTAMWRRHWAELLHGQEMRWSELAKVASEYAIQHTRRKRKDLLTLHDVQAALERKNPHKATGPSGIPISVWQVGGERSARILLALLNTTRVMGRSAVAMRGGRVQELYKNKGDRSETKSHRRILVQDPPGAMHASFLKRDIDEHYMKFIHETQCGCAKGRGTCMAGQIVELAGNFSKGRGKCWGRLYLDLSATFDSILREFLIAHMMCSNCNPHSRR